MINSVLFVDDEEEFSANSQIYLEREGYVVATESDGNTIVEQAQTLNPDIVVLDIDLRMDTIDGRVICSELCRLPAYRSGALKIILMSGQYVTSMDKIMGFKVGADNYLVKPFQMAQLTGMIKALLRRSQPPSKNKLHIDERLSIDYPCRTISLNGRSIPLTQLEFNLLSYLAQPPNQVRTKYELLDAVWQTQHIEDGAISKCVHHIRKKISPESTEQYIKTIFGVGYLLSSTSCCDFHRGECS